MQRTRILLADDHEAVRAAIRNLLRKVPEYEVCGEAVDGKEAIKKTKDLRPDVILLDISFSDMTGLDVAPVIRKEVPDCGILVVSQHDPEHMKPRALRAGEHGFVSKASLSKDLLAAIRALVASRSEPNKPPGGGLNEGFAIS
jgi:two-component system, NarL family, nitrate/nitrite response regulator NarL